MNKHPTVGKVFYFFMIIGMVLFIMGAVVNNWEIAFLGVWGMIIAVVYFLAVLFGAEER